MSSIATPSAAVTVTWAGSVSLCMPGLLSRAFGASPGLPLAAGGTCCTAAMAVSDSRHISVPAMPICHLCRQAAVAVVTRALMV